MAQLEDEAWILSPDTTLARLITSMCITAGFQPKVTATVNDLGTAIGLVGIGWGITIAPEFTPVKGTAEVRRLRITGVDVVRHRVLIVRDGEHLSPRLAAAISAVRAISSGKPVSPALTTP
jgi:DNA-binding transcriptional LysR family regulator